MEPLLTFANDARSDRGHVETVVAVEVGILDRHHGLPERYRHLGQRDQTRSTSAWSFATSFPSRSRSTVVSARGGMSGRSVVT